MRFSELAEQMNAVGASEHTVHSEMFGVSNYVDGESFLEWKVKAKNLIVKVCGESSEHYKEFLNSEKSRGFGTNLDQFKRVKSVFLAAKEDFEGGYLTSFKTLVQSEVFDNELEQAQELLKSGYHGAAAVIAGVVLETGLRELCTRQGIDHGKLDKMNADLAKAGVYNRLQLKRITALADIRNSAAHGKPDEFTKEDVQMMIRDVEQFLATQLDE
nr:HEPN domain-containing protein [Marinobacter adhaerens]